MKPRQVKILKYFSQRKASSKSHVWLNVHVSSPFGNFMHQSQTIVPLDVQHVVKYPLPFANVSLHSFVDTFLFSKLSNGIHSLGECPISSYATRTYCQKHGNLHLPTLWCLPKLVVGASAGWYRCSSLYLTATKQSPCGGTDSANFASSLRSRDAKIIGTISDGTASIPTWSNRATYQTRQFKLYAVLRSLLARAINVDWHLVFIY